MIKVSGLDKLTQQMNELAKFSEEVDGELATVSFDPTDPASIEAAVSEIEAAIEQKAIPYEGNDMVFALLEQMKENLRDQILEKAAAARLEGDGE
ncbi:hypothetical protein C5L14_25580 [Labrys okinawensis]|uniref:Uncharacterized protein n=1 Tax=Labrys okinawensis TaxID=346911 RepID=A0A2S9Q5G0_9HYPH|nr:hypothetical protein [Labrys okinawensis]PRH84577.1 hypothetical protein C5L14_25580 [Labrys okinawensis]